MAVDIFLKIGALKGESKDHKHKESIDILAFSWGMSNAASFDVGGGGGSGKVNVQNLSVTKYIDKCTPELMLAACNGKHFPDALLTVRKAGEKPIEYLKIKMTEVLITSVSTGGSGNEDRLTENLAMAFAKVNVDYTPQKQDGTGDAAITMGWNILSNEKV